MRPLYILSVALSAVLFSSCQKSGDPLFSRLSSGETGITFSNDIEQYESSTLNPLDYDYLYNGGGVAVADFNNDGKPDVYFSGNKVSSKLYLNEGAFHFRDVTTESATGTSQWATGVSAVDINQDGWMDLYVCMAGPSDNPADKANRLFINVGKTPDNRSAGAVPKFREMAHEMGLDDTGYSTQAAFLDYDKDGDLDMYLLTNLVTKTNRNVVRPKYVHGESPSTDRLYRNEGNGHFKNVSQEAGITIEGYGLGVVVSDLNADGWPDIYVANDFLSNDLLWINQHDGTFKNRARESVKHTTWNGMGIDVADINNDARPDVMVVDMLPESSPRQKQMMMKQNVDLYQLLGTMNYETQQVRNTLQLNNGPIPQPGSNVPGVSFSEIGQLAGIEKTDWSWSTLFADFDNDGHRDILVTNGYRREVNNLDYIAKLNEASPFGDLGNQGLEQRAKTQNLADLKDLPNLKMRNYLYQNRGDLTFADQSEAWGMTDETYSNGAAYADLDGDGDLDLVINNMDEEAGIYRNNLYGDKTAEKPTAHFLRLRLTGDAQGRYARDASVTLLFKNGQKQWQENSPVRGFVSSVEPVLHFGLAAETNVPTVLIQWSNGQRQTLTNVRADQTLTVAYQPDAVQTAPANVPTPYFTMLDSVQTGLSANHIDNEIIDFKRTPILPNRLSKNGPGIAVGDVNNDGLDDVFIGADAGQVRQVRIQQPGGTFRNVPLTAPTTPNSPADDMGALFLDVDNDRDLDLYVVSGGSHEEGDGPTYQDRLYTNDGKGHFQLLEGVLPVTRSSGSCVVAADYDRDGDLDLFRAGRVIPGTYPLPASSCLLVNDGRGRFTDQTAQLAPDLQKPGLVCAALWTDYDQNGTPDLLLVGEWMAPTFYKNDGRKLTKAHIIPQAEGWWNSAVAADFDHDGDMDYVLGNAGLNHPYRASVAEPVAVYASDFDKNGRMDPVVTRYFQHTNYVSALRDMFLDQMPGIRNRYKTYGDFAKVPFDDFFSKDEMASATRLQAVCMSSAYLENRGSQGGALPFVLRPLPIPAQVSAIFGMQVLDANNDGHPDLLAVGNSYAPDPQTGNLDASVGTLLLGNGKGQLTAVPAPQTGLYADQNAKALACIRIGGQPTYLLTNNNGPIQGIRLAKPQPGSWFPLKPTDAGALITLPTGTRYRHELGYGSGYLAQSARAVWVPTGAKAVGY